MLKILQLTDDFHEINNDLIEAINDKNRGYGIVTITLNNLIFGIPLRSNITHKYSLILDVVNRHGKKSSRGLDFTKAVLIRATAEMGEVFFIPENQKKVLIIGIDGARADAVQTANTPNIDLLINNAGVGDSGKLNEYSWSAS